jgi:hypothetical protein
MTSFLTECDRSGAGRVPAGALAAIAALGLIGRRHRNG